MYVLEYREDIRLYYMYSILDVYVYVLEYQEDIRLYYMYYISLLATKQDNWIAINPLTGNKLYSFGSEGMEETCPVDDTNTNILHIPQTGK